MNEIMDFMSRDHDRLDALFCDYRAARPRDLGRARAVYGEFEQGLRRHIRWEEELLFPAFESKTGMRGSGPTAVMRSEHQEIQTGLAEIARLLGSADPGGVDAVEQRLLDVLGPHNVKEEEVLYPWSDRALGEGERRAMLQRMQAESAAPPPARPPRARARTRGAA